MREHRPRPPCGVGVLGLSLQVRAALVTESGALCDNHRSDGDNNCSGNYHHASTLRFDHGHDNHRSDDNVDMGARNVNDRDHHNSSRLHHGPQQHGDT